MLSSLAQRCPFRVWVAIAAFTSSCAANDARSSSAAAGSQNGGATSASGASSAGNQSAGATSAAGSRAAGATNSGEAPSELGSADCVHDGDGRTTLVFVNACSGPVTYRGSDIAGSVLAPGDAGCVDIGSDVEALSAKRYWGFRGQDPGAEHHSLAEFTFNTDFNDFDWYNISYVDAFNLPLQIEPLARPKCAVLSCPSDLLPGCPSVGRLLDSRGDLLACVSPDRNDALSPVARYFESCDDAYAWSGDDQKGDDPSPVRACAGEDWQITFCPGTP
ncbi:MAG TPA: thaumatin family protein [Polyangiaceae bacterium]|nr:thaumatin family protein [Polyangiaceae bacterium]